MSDATGFNKLKRVGVWPCTENRTIHISSAGITGSPSAADGHGVVTSVRATFVYGEALVFDVVDGDWLKSVLRRE